MQFAMAFANEELPLQVDEGRLLAPPQRFLPVLSDPVAAVRAALESPFRFPPLRRALTPDDHVALVVDETQPGVGRLLVPVLEHIASAGVAPQAITLVCPPSASRQEWIEDLPDDFQDVELEVHDPKNRKRLAYLATTAAGRRLYLNRRVVEADQVVVLGGRRFDALLGYSGAEGDLFPALSDEPTRAELLGRLSLDIPGRKPWPVREEALETSWLLGTPFFIQLIEGAGDKLAHVVTGVAEASAEGQRLQDVCWKRAASGLADLVVAGIGGAPERHSFATLAAAALCAARVVQPDGRILLLTRAKPELAAGFQTLIEADEPAQALKKLEREPDIGLLAALQWAQAANRAHISLLSALPDETVEDLFASPLQGTGQVQRWLDRGGSCLILEDAHKSLAVVET